MSPDPFDEVDRALASGLARLAPDVDGADETLAAVRPRFERARTRARIVRASAGLATVLAVGAIAVAAAPSQTRSHVSVTSPSSGPGTTAAVKPTSSTRASTTTVPPTKTSPTTAPVTAPTNTGTTPHGTGPRGTVVVTTPATVPGGDGGGKGPSGGGHGPGGQSTTTTTFSNQSSIRVYRTPGGSVTVRVSRRGIVLVQVTRARGYWADVKNRGPAKVDVRFMVGNDEKYRVVLQLGDNGQVVRNVHQGRR